MQTQVTFKATPNNDNPPFNWFLDNTPVRSWVPADGNLSGAVGWDLQSIETGHNTGVWLTYPEVWVLTSAQDGNLINTQGASGTGIFSLNTTFEELGVPPGSVITGIDGGTISSKCITLHGSGNGIVKPATIDVGTGPQPLTGSRSFSALDSAFVASAAGSNISGLSLPSNTPVTLSVSMTVANGTQKNSTIIVIMDQLTFGVEYTPPA